MKQILIVGLVTVLLAGCTSVRIVAKENNPRECEYYDGTCGWSCDLEGGYREITVANDVGLVTNTIGAITVKHTYFSSLLTVFSLGLWMPTEIIYEVNQ